MLNSISGQLRSHSLSLFNELKRRNVFRVAIAYVVVAWLVMQIADVVLNNITAPGWIFQVLLLFLGLGLPLAIIFAWAFEMTPEGL
jgi:adenylate cyclase